MNNHSPILDDPDWLGHNDIYFKRVEEQVQELLNSTLSQVRSSSSPIPDWSSFESNKQSKKTTSVGGLGNPDLYNNSAFDFSEIEAAFLASLRKSLDTHNSQSPNGAASMSPPIILDDEEDTESFAAGVSKYINGLSILENGESPNAFRRIEHVPLPVSNHIENGSNFLQDKVDALERDREETRRTLSTMGTQYQDLQVGAESGESLIKFASNSEPPITLETKTLFDNVSPPNHLERYSPFRVHSVSPPPPPPAPQNQEPLFQVPAITGGEPHFLKTLELEIEKEQEYRLKLEEENRQMEAWLMQKIKNQVEENNRAAMALPVIGKTTTDRDSLKWVTPKSTYPHPKAKRKDEWKDNLEFNDQESRQIHMGKNNLKSSRHSSLSSSARSLVRKTSQSPIPFITGKSTTKSHNNLVQMQNSHYLKKISNPSTLSLKGKRESPSHHNKDDKITTLEHELAILNDQYQETLSMYTTRKSRNINRQGMELKLKEILKSMEIKGKQLLALTSLIRNPPI